MDHGAEKRRASRDLVDNGALQLDPGTTKSGTSLFDEKNLIALTHEDFPGERLVACRNGALANRLTAGPPSDGI